MKIFGGRRVCNEGEEWQKTTIENMSALFDVIVEKYPTNNACFHSDAAIVQSGVWIFIIKQQSYHNAYIKIEGPKSVDSLQLVATAKPQENDMLSLDTLFLNEWKIGWIFHGSIKLREQ